MEHQTDPDYLRQQAYDDADDLNVRTHILEHYCAYSQSWYRWLFGQMALPANGRILELGCGPGDLWRQNRQRLQSGWRLCLSDLSAGMLGEARRLLAGCTGSFSFALFDAATLPFAGQTFDVVLAFGLLDHLPRGDQALRQIKRVLRPSGLFYTSAGGRSHLQQLENLIKPFLPTANYGGDSAQFGYQNGARKLASVFTAVQQSPYENKLIFRQPEPLIAYVLSEPEVRHQLTAAQLFAFEKHVKETLQRQGEIVVTVKKGVFVGRRTSSPTR